MSFSTESPPLHTKPQRAKVCHLKIQTLLKAKNAPIRLGENAIPLKILLQEVNLM